MNWQDTVMSDEQIEKLLTKIGYGERIRSGALFSYEHEINRIFREAQAEISFKAGMEEEAKGGHNAISYLEGYQEGEKRGIRKVVGFINDLIIGIDGCEFEERLDGDKGCIVLDMNENQWQAKLKEWGRK